ncbi:MAG: hypothetical protein L0Y73_08605, partial [Candidatus Aminicenantes bacterium]|nr:hypothetical protein [Candidatus Aminicenantes bacterium]
MRNSTQNIRSAFPVLLPIILALFFSQCRKSEDELILDTVRQIGSFAEKRDIQGVLSFISADYSDDEKHTYLDIENLLNEYFDRYRGIVVNVLGTKIIKIKLPQAEIQTDVALSSGAAKIFRKAVRYTGEFYRFDLTLV